MKEDIYEHVGAFPSKEPSQKRIEFDMSKDESASMFARMVSSLHNQGVVFTIEQDFNLIWVCL
jgi:hypothetical protein